MERFFVFNFSVFVLLLLKNCECAHLKLYQGINYTSLVLEKDVLGEDEAKCHNLLPETVTNGEGGSILIESIKTDTCIIIYGTNDCQKPHDFQITFLFEQSFRVDGDVPDLTNYVGAGLLPARAVSSFHICNEKLGGGRVVDVDIYEKEVFQGKILASYKNVTSCQNLPFALHRGNETKFSIDNHGNGIDIFAGENCTGENLRIDGGYHFQSAAVATRWGCEENAEISFDVQSFRPSFEPTSFKKITPDCFKIEG